MSASGNNAMQETTRPLVRPGIQVTNYWTLYFRHGMNASLSKNFYYEGDLTGAVRRAQDHCKVMGYKYIWLRPLICNIDEEEEYKKSGGLSGTQVLGL